MEHASEFESKESRKLGRLVSLDPRDRGFLLSPPKEIDRMSMHWITAKAMDQGRKPHCVAFAGHQLLISSPVKNIPYKSTKDLYDDCQRNDEWVGENYDGTSVRALMRVLKRDGFISTYKWAFDLDTVIRHVLTAGPLVLGTSWHYRMFYPFKFGKETFIKTGGGIAGGHAYLLKGINLERPCHCGELGAARIMNSWSASWADGGKAWICLKDLALLIADWGEAACPVELKFRPVV